MSIVLRYYFNNEVCESFLQFTPATALDAASLSNVILNCLQSRGLDVKSCLVGQGYDGASVMSGAHKGVQQKVREHAPLVIYVHCWAHKLNLALVDCCKSVSQAAEFFTLIERLYVFTCGSAVRAKWVELQQRCYPGETSRQLKRLSDTRWACRYAACHVIRDRLEVIILLLEELIDGENRDRAVEARGLLSLLDFEFVVTLIFFV
jgi:hypothetical protein